MRLFSMNHMDELSKYDHIIVCTTKTQLGWLNLPHLQINILLAPVTVRSTVRMVFHGRYAG